MTTIYLHRYYGVGNNIPGPYPAPAAELCTTLPVLTNYTQPRVIYQIDLGTAPQPGEILVINARCEVTDPGYNTNIAVADGLYLNNQPADAGGYPHGGGTGIELNEVLGENFNLPLHHHVSGASRQWLCTGSEGVTADHHWLQYTLTSASSAALPGWALVVEQDYGQMDCIRWTPAVLEDLILATVGAAGGGLVAHTHDGGETGPAVAAP